MRKLPIVVVAFVLVLLTFAPAYAEEVLDERWDRLHMQGSRAGYTHTRVLKVSEGDETRIETHNHSEFKIKRMGATIQSASDTVTWETPEGKLLRIESTTRSSMQGDQHVVYTFSDGKLKIETTVLGETRVVEKEVPADLVGPYEIQKCTTALVGTKDQTFSHTTFVAELSKPAKTTVTSYGAEPVTLWGGEEKTLTRVVAIIEGWPAKPTSWLLPDGQPAVVRADMMGLTIETFRVADKAAAIADDGNKPDPDLFTATLIHEDGPVPVPRHVEAATIIVRKKKADAELPTYSSPAHEAVLLADGSQRICARRLTPPDGKFGTRPLVDPPEEPAAALAPNTMIQSDAPEIVKIANEVVGDETRAWQAAQKLETWVLEGVTEKGMGVGFATALEVCRNREGDCTEHAVLLAALCRAAGIPARVVMGFEYIYGIWGGHAWNEVWIEGTWYPLDATLGYGYADPLHLPLAHMTLKDGDFGAEFMGMLSNIGNIEIDVIEVVRDCRTIAVNDPALVTMEGRSYRNAVWGFGFDAPEGFTFDPPKPRQGMSMKIMELDGKTASGKPVAIKVRAADAPPKDDWSAILEAFKLDEQKIEEIEIDDHPGRHVTLPNGNRMVLALADGALYIFELKGVEGPDELKALESFLASVDFDVR